MPRCVWPEWEFVKRIGRGAYGTVYEAVRTDDYGVESRSAIKVVSIPQDEAELESLRTDGMDYDASKTYMRQIVNSFVNEVKLMVQLKGVPNIVSVEDYKVVERTEEIGWDISIRMELLTPLATYISDKTMTETEVAKIGCDICSALEVCEKKNIIHRDIKPANIFVNEFGDFKLGDFGIAKQMEGLTYDLSRKGTGAYMAPEVEKGASYNATVDLYSLGLVLYYLLNNKRLPFNDPNKQLLTPNERERAIRRRLDGETLPAPCDASPEMTGVIRCACAYDPRQRFRSAEAMRNSLQPLIKEEGYAGKHKTQAAAAPVEEPAAIQDEPEQALSAKEESKSAEKRTKRIRRILLIVIIIACVVVALFAVQRIRGSRLESYYQHALELHEQLAEDGLPDYDACIQYINEDILQNTKINLKQSLMADVYYLYADSLFEEGEYSEAIKYYWKLFQIGTEDPLYYRDCAIALAYAGYDTLPESYLGEARKLGLDERNDSFAKGEIAKARSEYDDAIEEFNNCISSAEKVDDVDLQALAYLRIADAYAEKGDKASERRALYTAQDIDSSLRPQILQKLIRVDMELADEVVDDDTASNYREEAKEVEEKAEENGWDYSNIIDSY